MYIIYSGCFDVGQHGYNSKKSAGKISPEGQGWCQEISSETFFTGEKPVIQMMPITAS
jgi:hypothetical protein